MWIDWAIFGGFLSGALAGGAARYGRLCTMSAIEDALLGRDYRAGKAWGIALAVAIAATQVGVIAGIIDLERNAFTRADVQIFGTAVGGLIFGLGMSLVGTCSFGLIVRAGSGDLRAIVSACVVGIFAFAMTAGVLAPVQAMLRDVGTINVTGAMPATIDRAVTVMWGSTAGHLFVFGLPVILIMLAFGDRRLWRRPRLLAGAVVLGLAVALGWSFSALAMDAMSLDRPESLSFVAPVGRALLQFMTLPFRNVGFGVAAVFGVLFASMLVTVVQGQLRWEAFDDAREMRRHLAGAALMGVGGVLARGCTIGQGLSAASVLAITAPVFMVAVVTGAWFGLRHLIDGDSFWHRWRMPRR